MSSARRVNQDADLSPHVSLGEKRNEPGYKKGDGFAVRRRLRRQKRDKLLRYSKRRGLPTNPSDEAK